MHALECLRQKSNDQANDTAWREINRWALSFSFSLSRKAKYTNTAIGHAYFSIRNIDGGIRS